MALNKIIFSFFSFFFFLGNTFSLDYNYELKTIYIDFQKPGEVTSFKEGIPVDIYLPQNQPEVKTKGDILVLPGWKFSRKRWQNETRLLDFCKKNSYRCIFPEMNVSVYSSEYFKETTLKWSLLPGGKWIKEAFIPLMQKKGFFKKNHNNFLIGLSTGGRGVALVSLQNPGLFKAGASLSGDYNQLDMPGDNLMKALYGDFSQFKSRWKNIDNPYQMALEGKWTMPIYLAHGTSDRVVPFNQTLSFYKLLNKKYPSLMVEFHESRNSGHDFKFWDSELPGIFDFFKKIK